MSKLLKAVAAAMLVLYGLALSHCALEQFSGLEFLSCCEHQDAAPHHDNECARDACSVVESGFYKTTDHDEVAPVPLFVLTSLVLSLESEPASATRNSKLFTSAPPELPRLWQFCLRTALPPRAPSIAS